MNLRSLILSLQFLTRLPTPRIADFRPEDLSRSSDWFPLVGIIVGCSVAAAIWVGQHATPWIAALAALVVWVWITGALHLDGLGDVADGLAAAHRSPERFLEVLRDPHVGAFGAIAIALQLIAKIVLLAEVARHSLLGALVLIPAWARWGTLVWSATVSPLASGTGERFSWRINQTSMLAQGAVLAGLSFWLSPALLAALLIVPALSLYWRLRLGGITGDCLGASVEVTETLLLVVVVLAATMSV
jgi:adenosylcobinamide-GDP ribazoletransferase